MGEVGIIVSGPSAAAAGDLLLDACAAVGLSAQVVDAGAPGLPAFDARPPERCGTSFQDVRRQLEEVRTLIVHLHARPTGVPAPILNLFQLLGGPSYGGPTGMLPLRGTSVAVWVEGSGGPAALARTQADALVSAQGGALVAAGQGTLTAAQARALAEALCRGPSFRIADQPIDLGLGHVHLPPADVIVDVLRREAGTVSRYAPPAGIPTLRREVLEEVGGGDETFAVVVTAGASGALSSVLGSELSSGDRVLVPDPGFPNYRPLLHARGLTAVPYELRPERGFMPDQEELGELAASASALLWNSPHNPSGAVAPEDVVRSIVALCKRHDLLLISDEVYAEFVWEGTHTSVVDVGPPRRFAVVGSMSKTFAMAGHRVGWLLAPKDLAAQAARVHWAEHMGAPLPAQRAADAAMRRHEEVVGALRHRLALSRRIALRQLAALGLPFAPPAGGLYLWMRIGEDEASAEAFAARLAEEEGVTVLPGSAFGDTAGGWLRVSFAADPETVAAGWERITRSWHRNRTRTRHGHEAEPTYA